MNAKVFKKALVCLTLAIPFATSSSYCSSDKPHADINNFTDPKNNNQIKKIIETDDPNINKENKNLDNLDNKELKKISAAIDRGKMDLFVEMLKNEKTKKAIIEYLKSEINTKRFDNTKLQIGDNENFQVQSSNIKKPNDLEIVKENDLKLEAIEKEKKDNNKPFEITSAKDNVLTVNALTVEKHNMWQDKKLLEERKEALAIPALKKDAKDAFEIEYRNEINIPSKERADNVVEQRDEISLSAESAEKEQLQPDYIDELFLEQLPKKDPAMQVADQIEILAPEKEKFEIQYIDPVEVIDERTDNVIEQIQHIHIPGTKLKKTDNKTSETGTQTSETDNKTSKDKYIHNNVNNINNLSNKNKSNKSTKKNNNIYTGKKELSAELVQSFKDYFDLIQKNIDSKYNIQVLKNNLIARHKQCDPSNVQESESILAAIKFLNPIDKYVRDIQTRLIEVYKFVINKTFYNSNYISQKYNNTLDKILVEKIKSSNLDTLANYVAVQTNELNITEINVQEILRVLKNIRESFEQPSSDGSFFVTLLENCMTASSVYNNLLINVDKFYTSLTKKIQDQSTFYNDTNLKTQEQDISKNINAVYNEYNKNLKVLLLLLRTIPNIGD